MAAPNQQLVHLPTAGDVVGRYRIVGEVAHGGMSAVFSAAWAEVKGFDRIFAIKFLLPHLATDSGHVDMFLDEAQIASRVQHRNVVQVFDVGNERGLPFLVMEYLQGQSLARLASSTRDRGEDLDVAQACHIMAQAASGLHAAHTAKSQDGTAFDIVHRDFNGHNIHVGYDGTIKVVDFGVAAARGRRSHTRSGEIKGKLAYLAPEQISLLHPTTAATDIFSLGITLWELLLGEKLFRGESDARTLWNVMNRQIPDPAIRRPDLPEGLRDLVMACLNRDPMDRPRSAGDIASELQRYSRIDDAERLAHSMSRLFTEEKERSGRLLEEALTISKSFAPESLPERRAPLPGPGSRSRWPLAALGVAVALSAAGILYAFAGRGAAERPTSSNDFEDTTRAVVETEVASEQAAAPLIRDTELVPPGPSAVATTTSGPTETATNHPSKTTRRPRRRRPRTRAPRREPTPRMGEVTGGSGLLDFTVGDP